MAQIETLIDDVADVLEQGTKVDPELATKYGNLFAEMCATRLEPREPKERGTLRMSSIGQPCERKLWYQVNTPNDAEPLKAHTKLKYLYGDVIELVLLFLAEASGHTVEGTQGEQEIAGIKGHRDGVIDGVLVDTKSASTYSFNKFADGTLDKSNDSFGYITQIQSYLEAGKDDPIITDKSRAAFFVADKTLGHFCLDFHEPADENLEEKFEAKKAVVELPEPPERAFEPVPEGKSGNEKLPMNCSYCDFKFKCWPNVRQFNYSNGPVFLTRVVQTPRVPETIREPNA